MLLKDERMKPAKKVQSRTMEFLEVPQRKMRMTVVGREDIMKF